MNSKLISTLTLVFSILFVKAQTNSLRLSPRIILPGDSMVSKALTTSLNDFLISAQHPNEENKFVFGDEKIVTNIVLDEMNGIEKSGKFKDDYFFKPYLTNVVPLKDNQFLI